MFAFIAIIGYALVLLALVWGFRRAKEADDPRRMLPGVFLAAAIGLAFWGSFWFLDFYGEWLWYDSLGYAERFTDIWTRQLVLTLGGALVAGLITWGITRLAMASRAISIVATLLSAATGASTAANLWSDVLLFQNATMTGTTDPVLGVDVGFYLFQLPLLRALVWPILSALILGGLTAAVTWIIRQGGAHLKPEIRQLLLRFEKRPVNWVAATAAPLRALLVTGGLVALALAYLSHLRRYSLVIDGTGFSAGAGFVDSRYLIPAHTVLAVIVGLTGLAVIVLAILRRDLGSLRKLSRLTAFAGAAVALVWMVAVLMIPAVIQRFRVSPNELAAEQPYIRRSIEFTRRAFGIDSVRERTLETVGTLTPEVAQANQDLLDDVPLWDYRALLQVFSQFQEIRLYYSFADVDIDRYQINGTTRQLMLGAREMDQTALPEQSRTFLNLRFKYTHGHGVVAAPVTEFTPDGQPRYMIANIPARSAVPSLEITRPEIYFGELTNEHVYVNSLEPEFDYPSGEENVEAFYEGTGGVQLNSFARKLAYAKRFDGTRLLFARHVTPETRVLFRRNIVQRVQALAPFLTLDADPYIVIADGRLYWILDAYTSSDNYPYSEHYGWNGRRINYFRNSVKVVVDAYNGTTQLFVADTQDPIVATWAKGIPDLFRPLTEMPAALRAHIRYPEGLLIVQGTVYAKYHMGDLSVFYNNEDLWQPAREKYYSEEQEVEPYYTLWRAPDSPNIEFIQMWPFTPRGRNVMAGWLAGASDSTSYGHLFAYRLPKDRQVLGPLQFEAKIDQDEQLSQLMTLWSQGGSNVIRGHVLSIPIGDAIVHIEPIYLESQSSSFPELQLVAVMQGDQLGYGPNLDAALQMLYGQQSGTAPAQVSTRTGAQPSGAVSTTSPAATATAAGGTASLGRQASDAFDAYLRLQAAGQFEAAGRELARVRSLLQQLAAQ